MKLTKAKAMHIKHFQSHFLKAALLLALLTPGLTSAVMAAPGADGKTAPPQNISKIAIAPHRAIYDMGLASVKNGSNITGVSGRMLFQWSDVCDGWAVEQHLQLHFSYAEGEESDVTSTVISWESKDGKRYNFNVRRVSDGKVTDAFRGKAVLDDNGGTVTYTLPKEKVMKLAADTIFPSVHTGLIIEKGLEGEKFFSRRVFDGSDEEGSNDISAFIGPQMTPGAHVQTTDGKSKLKDSPLLAAPGWPVRMAFFKLHTETGEPDYEMNLNLLANGVASGMTLDYGDFSVSGTLTHIESLPSPGC